eukprot:CAMPEP_0176253194 /NCGR_PEP_ID=MMETSP0121_2-20121125/35890_1 /TAXON_ID=160619 /ORGANISM="Kryptoperidinium foliaceum, Strain CCMP 1326" /LENGTH=110 /DNA_ID=CAMNT_0017592963 /DNA_START=70 /DNA_END=400 /DNA_ORIENTATION=+
MKFVAGVIALGVCGGAAFEPCKVQDAFDIMMCKSHMCTACSLEWCMTACQELQEKNPECACAEWPAGQTSYSAGDFKGKGKVGDSGDYSKEHWSVPPLWSSAPAQAGVQK